LDEEVGWLVTSKPKSQFFFAVNKLDSRQRENNLLTEFYALGLDKLYSISAEHGIGIPDLMDDVVQHLAPIWTASKTMTRQ
jgi:GTP-binding protein